MKSQLIKIALIASLGALTMASCKDKKTTPVEELKTTALYDTLGWFIQGATGPVAGQGTKMIDDPEATGKKIQAGRLAIRTVIEKAEYVLAGDPQMAPFFPTLLAEVGAGNTTGFIELRENFTDLVQQVASGQEVYKGLDMVTTHDHSKNPRFGSTTQMKADNQSFDRFLVDVVDAMTQLGVPPSVQGQLGAALEATRSQVVQQ